MVVVSITQHPKHIPPINPREMSLHMLAYGMKKTRPADALLLMLKNISCNLSGVCVGGDTGCSV